MRTSTRGRKVKTYTYNDMTMTAREWAAHLNITVNTFRSRLWMHGDSSPEKVFCPPRQGLYTYKGQTLALWEWSKKTGIPEKTIRSRLADGWEFARAITQPYQRHKGNNRKLTASERTVITNAPTAVLVEELKRRKEAGEI